MADIEDEDDLPIAELMRRRAAAREAQAQAQAQAQAVANKKIIKQEKPTPSKSVSQPAKIISKPKEKEPIKVKRQDHDKDRDRDRNRDREKIKFNSSSSNNMKSKTEIFYEESSKGKLVQALLIRWWYAITWPASGDIGSPPAGYEALDGFKGVFVSTRVSNHKFSFHMLLDLYLINFAIFKTDSLGKILDLRNTATCPSFKNLSKKPSEELKNLCIKAIEEQIKELISVEGSGTKLEALLRSELRDINKIDTERADRKASRFL